MNQERYTKPAAGFPGSIICLSHLRWDFVFQRPQHLLSRMAKQSDVYYIEEPVFGAADTPHYTRTEREEGVQVLVPMLPESRRGEAEDLQRLLLDQLAATLDMSDTLLWYYTPMAIGFSRHLRPAAVVFDVMDELSAFKFAPPELRDRERELLQKADVVFTGGASLYESKKHSHSNIHLFPSSIDRAHFAQALTLTEPADQASLPRPRLGFFGVIDERFDIDLIRDIAQARPQWQIVLVGPVVKIDPATLPQLPNLHYTGGRQYAELPAYLSGWDIALIPFALNESTRFISPTKTPEYLAAGRPVISSPIRDVVTPYGDRRLVKIAGSAAEWIAAAEELLSMTDAERAEWKTRTDAFLAGSSWDQTVADMRQLVAGIFTGVPPAAKDRSAAATV